MKNDRFRRWLDRGSDALDESLERDLARGDGKAPEDPFERPHPTEEMAYDRIRSWTRRSGERLLRRVYLVLSVLVCCTLSLVLIRESLDLPQFGGSEPMTDNEVSTFYVEEGLSHTGAKNIVTGIILEFRGFDTLGESHVLFIAVCTVLILLRLSDGNTEEERKERLEAEADDRRLEPAGDPILKSGAGYLLPLILVFGIYILLNGHLSPGGGFSGGAILGAGLILYLLAFGFVRTGRFFNMKVFRVISTCALLFYSVSKFWVFFSGANGIENGLSAGTFGSIYSGGLLMPLSLAVGSVVACTMYALYALFRRGDL